MSELEQALEQTHDALSEALGEIAQTEDRVRETCAAEVEAAGCICFLMEDAELDHTATFFPPGARAFGLVRTHDGRCPKALAAKLREMGR